MTIQERAELRTLVNSPDVPATVATRAGIVLWRAEGRPKKELAALAGATRPTVDLWLDRYAREGLGGHGTTSSRRRMRHFRAFRTLLTAIHAFAFPCAPRSSREPGMRAVACLEEVIVNLVGRLLGKVYRAAVDAGLDRRYRVQTLEEVNLEDLGLAAQDREYYGPSRWTTLRKILPQHEVGEQDVFIDFGSGKGRIVLQAATYPFKRVIGIELSEQLNEIALANLRRYSARAECADIQLVRADARDFNVPDDVTVAFFYNPFKGAIFESVIGKLIASYDRSPRRMRIIYRNPVEEAALLATGRIRTIRSVAEITATTDRSRWDSIRMYEIAPRRNSDSDADRPDLPVVG